MNEKDVTSCLKDLDLDDETLIEQWDAIAPLWASFVGSHDIYRDELIAPQMLEMIGELEDKRVLDLCCGEGYFTRHVTRAGASSVVGIDYSKNMIRLAQDKERREPLGIKYYVGLINKMDCFEAGQFDIVISFMSMADVRDYESAFWEVSRVLVPKGKFLFSIFHPCFFSPVHGWEDDRFWKVDEYLTPVSHQHKWPTEPVGKEVQIETLHFHRPLSVYMRSLVNSGFLISNLIEPTIPERVLIDNPELAKSRRIPYFIILEAIRVRGTELDTTGSIKPVDKPTEINGLVIRNFRLTYELINQPFLFNLGRHRNVITNVRQSGRENDKGWLTLEIAGRKSEVESAVQYLQTIGIEIIEIDEK